MVAKPLEKATKNFGDSVVSGVGVVGVKEEAFLRFFSFSWRRLAASLRRRVILR